MQKYSASRSGSLSRTLGALFFVVLNLLVLGACSGGAANSGSDGGDGGSGGTKGGGGGGQTSGPFTAGRTKYVRTDATTEYYQWINPHWILYNPLTNYFYVTDPSSNHVIVMDATSESEVGVINVPGAYSIDDAPDHKTLYVGSVIGDVYAVDPIGMTVTNRYMGSQIGPSGYFASSAVVLADGRLALLGGTGGVSVDGAPSYALWSPTDNSFTLGNASCIFGSISALSRSPDRTKIILAGSTLCEVDESSGQSIAFGPGGFPAVNFRISPDGNYIVVPGSTLTAPPNSYAYVYDGTTLNLISQIPVSGDTSTAAGFAISADSKRLYVPNAWIIYAYDLASGQQVGWLPNMDVPVTSGGGAWGPISGPNLQAIDGTGLLVGPLEEGVAFVDTSTMQTGGVGSQFANGYANPAAGPVSANTQVHITEPVNFGALSGIYFGSQGSTDISGVSGPNTYGNFGYVSAVTPGGSVGPSDVYVFTTDGGMQLIPEGFSYGPTIVEVTPNMSTGEGGGTGVIFGYGFGPVSSGVSGPVPNNRKDSSGIPASLQMSIGGNPVQVTSFAPYAYPNQSPPFPLQALAYTIPSGTGSADVTVTTDSGSTTAHAALTYLPSVQQFALPGSALAQGIYDPHTDLYYFTDTSEIQVFSKALGSWQSPIAIPAPRGATQRLWGIALSPDGSKLAVSDVMAGVIYVLNPASPSSVKTFTIQPIYGPTTNPSGLAISDAGMVYYAVVEQGSSGARQFFKLDTATGKTLDYGIQGPNYPQDIYLRALISSDNSRVFFNDLGYVFYIDTATDKPVPSSIYVPCCYLDLGNYDMALSSDQSRFQATGYLYDYNLEGESYYALNDREILSTSYVYGSKMSADGRLLFQPSTSGIDVLDGRVGNLLNRIALPVALSPNYDALVSSGKDNILIAITGTSGDGIALVDLTSIQEPVPLPYADRLNFNSRLAVAASMGSRSLQGSKPELALTARGIPHVTKTISAVTRKQP